MIVYIIYNYSCVCICIILDGNKLKIFVSGKGGDG